MDEILFILGALILWRVTLSTVGSIALALVLSTVIPPFTAGYCIAVVILGVVFGIYWQGRADADLTVAERVEEPTISRPVAFLGLSLIGLILGAGFAELFNSRLLGGIALCIGAIAVAAWYRYIQHQSFSRSAFAFALVSLLAGYSVVLLVVWATP